MDAVLTSGCVSWQHCCVCPCQEFPVETSLECKVQEQNVGKPAFEAESSLWFLDCGLETGHTVETMSTSLYGFYVFSGVFLPRLQKLQTVSPVRETCGTKLCEKCWELWSLKSIEGKWASCSSWELLVICTCCRAGCPCESGGGWERWWVAHWEQEKKCMTFEGLSRNNIVGGGAERRGSRTLFPGWLG